MNNVIPFKKESTIEGSAFCLQCAHTWTAIAPSGTVRLECPECHTEKGLFKFDCVPPEGTQIWVCNCGNDLFFITPVGHLCPNCGNYVSFD